MDTETRRPLGHVRSLLVFPIFRYALVMVIVSLASGIFAREFGRAHLSDLPLATQWLASHYLNQLHGHILVLGFVLPSGLGLITYTLRSEMTPADVGQLRSVFFVLALGSLATLILLLYQGVATVMMAGGDPALSLDQIDEQLFYGNADLRTILHTVSHTALGVSTAWYALKLRSILGLAGNYHRTRAT
jgi:hypothetical protein